MRGPEHGHPVLKLFNQFMFSRTGQPLNKPAIANLVHYQISPVQGIITLFVKISRHNLAAEKSINLLSIDMHECKLVEFRIICQSTAYPPKIRNISFVRRVTPIFVE